MSVKISGDTGTSLTQPGSLPFMIGEVKYFWLPAAPSGFIEASGQVVAVEDYQELVAVSYVGDSLNSTATYGYRCTNPATPSTSRSTTGQYFVVLDMRGEFARGLDKGRGIDTGRVLGTWQEDMFKSHAHDGVPHSATGGGGATSLVGGSGSTTNTGGAETRPRNIALLACIYVGK